MNRNARRFPLVADGDPVLEPSRPMSLYENEDLITNIRGAYQEKDYNDVTRDFNFVEGISNAHKSVPERVKTINEGKSYAEMAREEARRDIKKKRQAYLSKDVKLPSKEAFQKQMQASLPKAATKPASALSRFTEKMQQDDYILAELPIVYTEPNNTSLPKKQKNNYDFLKRSQIYNKQTNQSNRERQIAQELNLTRFEDVNQGIG